MLILEDPELSPVILKPRAGDLHGVTPNSSQDRDVSESHRKILGTASQEDGRVCPDPFINLR